jgi:hypothetical protein
VDYICSAEINDDLFAAAKHQILSGKTTEEVQALVDEISTPMSE